MKLTVSLIDTMKLCSNKVMFDISQLPKIPLSNPSEPNPSNTYDNMNGDYILYQNDVIQSPPPNETK